MLIGKDEATRNQLLAIYSYNTIKHAIDTYQRLRKWKFIDRVPAKRPNAKFICCEHMRSGRPGSALPLKFEMSPYQGELDADAEVATDNFKRFFVDGMIDYVVTLHFLQPAIWMNLDQQAEERPGLKQGFVPTELLPSETKRAIEWRKQRYGRSDRIVTDS